MIKRGAGVCALATLMVLSSACTAQSRYEGIREEQRQQCELAVSEPLRERCLEQLPPASYDDYEQLRRPAESPSAGAARLRAAREGLRLACEPPPRMKGT